MEAYSHFYRWGKKKEIERDKVDLSKQRPGLETKALDGRSSPFPEVSGSHIICLSVSLWTQMVAGEGVPWSVGFGRSGGGSWERAFLYKTLQMLLQPRVVLGPYFPPWARFTSCKLSATSEQGLSWVRYGCSPCLSPGANWSPSQCLWHLIHK